jgi:hypothetical protein
MSRPGFLLVLVVSCAVLGVGSAAAHPEGVTLSSLWVAEEGVRLEIVLPDRVLARDPAVADATADGPSPFLARVEQAFGVRADGEPCPRRAAPEVWRLPDIDARRYVLEFACPATASRLRVRDGLAAATSDAGHENFLRASVAGVERSVVLTPARPELELPLAEILGQPGRRLAPRWPRQAILTPGPLGFLVLGVEHILAGLDHVLFLVGLFLVAMPGRRILGIVTAFTVGHSLTLGLSALGLYSPTPWIAESAIALSIVYLAVENLRALRRSSRAEVVGARPAGSWGGARPVRHRWVAAGLFGLVHGFGFSYVLRDLGLPEGSRLASLAGFNLGVEIGQLVVVALLVPLLAWTWRRLAYAPVAALGSAALGLIGGWWVVERTLL